MLRKLLDLITRPMSMATIPEPCGGTQNPAGADNPSDQLILHIGHFYPAMFAGDPVTIRVDKIVKFNAETTVFFTVESPHMTHSWALERLCDRIAERLAYDNSTVHSVNVTAYFKKYGLVGGGK